MVQPIDAAGVQDLQKRGAQLVEVLPPEEYEQQHLAGAISIPLKQLDEDTATQLDKARPVIVYCYDQQCDQSPRAAVRLETLGFNEVYDYVVGKQDWTARGLPIEGSLPEPLALDATRPALTCSLDGGIESARKLADQAGDDGCIVIDDKGIVLGRVRSRPFYNNDETRVAQIMEEGPSTYRPNVPLKELVGKMKKGGLKSVVISDPDGKLVGILNLSRADLVLSTAIKLS